MSKVLGFSIEIQGERAVIEKAADVQLAIREINKQLKQTSDSAEYDKLEKELLRLKGTLKEVRAQQRQTVNEFTATAEGVGAYRQMSAQLNVARQRFKDLAAAGQEYTEEAQAALKETQRLDAELKRIDASAGQFQRNVGNYPSSMKELIGATVPFIGVLQQADEGIKGIESSTGRLIARSFILFSVVNEAAQGIAAIGDMSKEFVEFRRQASVSTNLVGQDLDDLVGNLVAASRVFNVEFTDVLKAANTVAFQFNTNATEGFEKLERALLGVADQSRFLSEVNSELSKLAAVGLDDESALSILVSATNNNFNVDVVAEPIIAIREQTEAAKEALIGAFGEQATREIFSEFEETPVKAIQNISRRMLALDRNTAAYGRVLADVFKAAGEDNVIAVEALGELATSTLDLTDAQAELNKKQELALAAQKELSAAQIELSKSLGLTEVGIENVGTKIKTFLIDALANAAKTIRFEFKRIDRAIREMRGVSRKELRAEEREQQESIERRQEFDKSNADFARSLREKEAEEARKNLLKSQQKEIALYRKLVDDKFAEDQALTADQLKELRKRQNQISDSYQRELEAHKEQQADLLAQDRKDQAARLQLLNQLNLQLVEATIDLMEDEREREIAQREQDFQVRKEVLQDQQAEQLELLDQREQEIIDLFGRKSEEYLNFVRDRKETEQELIVTTNELIVQLEADKQRDIEEINKRARESEQRRLLEESQSRIKQIQNASEIELLELDEQFAKKLISEEDYWDEVDRIRIAALRRQNDQLRLELSTQTDLTEEEYQRRILSIKKNEAEIAKLQAGGTDRDERGEQALADKQRENFEQSLGYAQQSLSVLDNFAQGIAERQNQRYQEQIDAQQSLVSNLEEEFETAVGLKRVQLAEELEAERAALSQSVEAQEQANREAARQEKAIAILQSIVNTALAVTRALATGGPVAAGVVGALGAVQTATIAAQPFAEGGVVTPVQLSDGKIIATKNIPTMANGDNVLATVKTGEVILNERHVQMLGPEVFRSLGVPGFDRGGVAGRLAEPIAPPIMPLLAMRSQQDIGRAIESLDRKTDAINARIDRLRAVVVSEDVEKDLQDKQDNLRLRTL